MATSAVKLQHQQMPRILITGSTGFIGSFIVEEALRRGMEVWAAVRQTSSRQYLTDERIHFICLDLSSEEALTEQLKGHVFDYVVHAAGATKAVRRSLFRETNTVGTMNIVRAIAACKMPIRMFVFMSSLSVFGPAREEQPYSDILDTDTPQPNTAYGKSKLEAEHFIDSFGKANRFPYIVLRPTGVYGPREKDYYLMMQSIARHIDVAAGFKRQDITFIYVKDLVQAVFLALEKGKSGRKYFLSDGDVYSSRTFSDLIHAELGNPWWLRLTLPLWLLRLITACGEVWGRISGQLTALNGDKYNIMKQRNWRCDISPAVTELGYKPKYKLAEGVRETVKWYKDHGWL